MAEKPRLRLSTAEDHLVLTISSPNENFDSLPCYLNKHFNARYFSGRPSAGVPEEYHIPLGMKNQLLGFLSDCKVTMKTTDNLSYVSKHGRRFTMPAFSFATCDIKSLMERPFTTFSNSLPTAGPAHGTTHGLATIITRAGSPSRTRSPKRESSKERDISWAFKD